jgi:type II secretion system protein J
MRIILPAKRKAIAFTLLEIILAVAVFAIVLGAINSVFFGALRLRNKTSETFAKILPLQQTLSIIKGDLEGILFPGGQMSGQFQTMPTGEVTIASLGMRVSPDIYTTTGVMDETSNWSEVRKVGYFLAMPTNNTSGKDLMRVVTSNLLPGTQEIPTTQWLMGGVDTMLFQFYDGQTWIETWDSTTTSNLPTAIKVQITLFPEKGDRVRGNPVELVVPVMIGSNSTNQATGGSS